MKKLLVLLAVVAIASFAPAVWADDSGSIGVSANVIKECVVNSSSDVAFGAYSPITAADDYTTTGQVSINCTLGTAVTVKLGEGDNYSTGRRMLNGTENFLTYGLFLDDQYATDWTAATSHVWLIESTAGTTADTHVVYAKMAKNQNQKLGAYADTVAITLTY